VARAACPERAEGPASRRQPGANQKAIVAEIDENAIARHLMEVLDLRSPPGRWPILARSQLARWTLRTELTQVVVHVEVGQTHPLGVGHAAEMGMRLPMEVSGLAREMVHEVLQIAQIGVENSGGARRFQTHAQPESVGQDRPSGARTSFPSGAAWWDGRIEVGRGVRLCRGD
jgi:hypothetical protein